MQIFKGLLPVIVGCVCLCIHTPLLVAGNLFSNAGFENGSPDPTNHGQFGDISEWSNEFFTTNDGNSWHSCDWFDGGFKHDNIDARNGSGYVGMQQFELMQQKLHNNEEYEDFEFYLVSMWIQLAATTPDGDDTEFTDAEIVIHFGREKMHYKALNTAGGEFCEENYRTLDVSGGQSIKTRLIEGDLTQFPVADGWHRVTAVVESPDRGGSFNKFDWTAIEVRQRGENPECSGAYVLIDDVEIIKFCDHPCAPEFGELTFTLPSAFDPAQSPPNYYEFIVFNATLYRMEIREEDVNGDIVWTQEEFSPQGLHNHPVFGRAHYTGTWNGRDNDGNALGDGQYHVNLKFGNCSETDERDVAVDMKNPPTQVDEFPPISPVYFIQDFDYKDCCLEHHELRAFPLNTEATYLASDFITAEQEYRIFSGKDIEFQAGNKITLKHGFAVANSDFRASIAACTVVPGAKQGDSGTVEDPVAPSATGLPLDIQVNPNPAANNIVITGLVRERYELSITDIMGRTMYAEQVEPSGAFNIDLTSWSPGVYLLTILQNNKMQTLSFVKR